MIHAAIFDMDGLLLDSEPLWQEAEIRVFGSVGIPLTREQCMEFMGVPVKEVVAHHFREHPWKGKTQERVTEEIIEGVEQLIRERGEPMKGVGEVLALVHRKGGKTALASSSAMRLILTVLKKFDLTEAFNVVHSAEFEDYGKPHPAVFLTTATKLGVNPAHCLVFEDSFNGVLAAKAARMKTIAIPDVHHRNDPRFVIADLTVQSLLQVGDREWNALAD